MTPSSRKILIIGRPKSGKLSLVKALTSSLPSGLVHETTPHAGLTHTIELTTRYYSTEAGIWIDEIPEDTETWINEYLSEEATPVLQSLAAVILTVNPATSKPDDELAILKKLNDRGEEIEWDGTCIIVGKQSSETASAADFSSRCEDEAIEYIDLNQSGQNEYGEKQGKSRVLEVLHTCDWTSLPTDETDSLTSSRDPGLDFELNFFDADADADAGKEGTEKDVDYMERMMAMLLHAREVGREIGLEERKRLAKRTVEEVAKMS